MFKIKKIILLIIVCFFVYIEWCPASFGDVCENKVVNINKEDNSNEITIDVGDILQIQLERFGSTGYEWYLDECYRNYFELISEDTEEISRKGFVGTPVLETWKFRAIKKGETDISLHLYRAWEGKSKSVDMFAIKVKIL